MLISNSRNIKVVDGKPMGQSKQYYVVKKGDTLSKIAVEHNTTVSILCKLNNMKKTDKLQIGRRLRIR